jgi:two-component system response regulator AtoC
LEKEIAGGGFREDLYYRLNVVNIEVAPLRHRRDEIPLFCDHFLTKFSEEYGRPQSSLPEELQSLFETYYWPGNVRELENLIKRYVVLRDAESVRSELESRMEQEQQEAVEGTIDGYLSEQGEDGWDLKQIRKQAVSVVEKSMIEKALRKTHWNKWKAAKELKVSYKTLLVKIDEYQLNPHPD